MKKYFIHVLVVLFSLTTLIFSGCKQEESLRIGLSIGPIHDRWEKDKDFFITKAESLGAKVLVKQASGDDQKQIEQAKELLEQDINVLVLIAENSESSSKIIEAAHAKNVKVIAYDRLIKNCDLDYYITFDNVKVGELQAEYLTRVKPVGNYAILGGSPDDYNSRLLNLGQMNIIQPLMDKGDINIVLNKYVQGWSDKLAYQYIKNYLSNPENKLDAIIASSDHLANGAYEALKEFDLAGEVLLSGQDAEIEACKRIVKGEQTMTIYKTIETLASAAATIAVTVGNGESISNTFVTVNNGQKMVQTLMIQSMYIVHQDNIRMTVIADGYIDENLIFEE